jgi:hypothetical protein
VLLTCYPFIPQSLLVIDFATVCGCPPRSEAWAVVGDSCDMKLLQVTPPFPIYLLFVVVYYYQVVNVTKRDGMLVREILSPLD